MYNFFVFIRKRAILITSFTFTDFLRSVAYRQFVRIVWAHVGMSNRFPLPCCVYSVMKSAFPIAEDQYHSYEEEDEDEL